MTDDQMRQLVAQELDRKVLDDLQLIMSTPEGRRFFCWIIMQCGQNRTSFTRDSRTYFNEGMRNVALMLEAKMRNIGLQGVDAMHQADREYTELADEIQRDIEIKLKGNSK